MEAAIPAALPLVDFPVHDHADGRTQRCYPVTVNRVIEAA